MGEKRALAFVCFHNCSSTAIGWNRNSEKSHGYTYISTSWLEFRIAKSGTTNAVLVLALSLVKNNLLCSGSYWERHEILK